ncbi:MAG TPA: chemotaxis response regulator protein-glutamate methylesterase [Candidatus Acidoferrales bacterium]|nr:chemotaxis response regulator protein-glutamate methylesterase [Candidatus Acidoferrales bacterium]
MAKIRVLVVDDAVVMRKLITESLRQDSALEVVGVAANGKIALQKIPQVSPDLLTLDLEMPEMDGLETLRELRKLYPKLPVIMFSTLTQKGGTATLEALSLGANDYVTKPANIGSVAEAMQRLEAELIPKIKVHCRHLFRESAPVEAPRAVSQVATPVTGDWPPLPVEIVCIGTSTGGPNALAEVFASLPANLPVPLVIVQHMPPLFTAMLAERLTAHSPIPCHEGTEGQLVESGQAYIAPGGRHMEVQRLGTRLKLHLHDGPLENSCRPAVDVLFRSAAAAYGGAVLGVVMTGMGQDGLRGCEAIRECHGRVIAQDEASSVVWGMPGSVARAGYAGKVVPLNRIATEITRMVQGSRPIH